MFLYGYHPCAQALKNKRRQILKIYVCDPVPELAGLGPYSLMKVSKKELEQLLPPGAVHQNIAMKVAPLGSYTMNMLKNKTGACVLVLDQVSDPHNVGAVFRSAGVFNVAAIVMTHRHMPGETSVLAKSACGALDIVPFISVNNLNQGLDELKALGFWIVGLCESGSLALSKIDLKGNIALVLGSEGQGMRPLTKKQCDFLAYIPANPAFSALNVSAAAAISLYEVSRQTTC